MSYNYIFCSRFISAIQGDSNQALPKIDPDIPFLFLL